MFSNVFESGQKKKGSGDSLLITFANPNICMQVLQLKEMKPSLPMWLNPRGDREQALVVRTYTT